MNNKIGMIEFAGKGSDNKKKIILLTAPCQHCQKIAIRAVDCPDRLQDAQPGMFVYVDKDGMLQATMGP